MRAHPIAEIFPLLEGAAFDALVSDIKEHGQRQPIIVWEDKILDGRNRDRACRAAKVEPKTKLFRGDERAALAFVLSTNLHRRHLDESQRAMVAARVATLRHGEKKADRPNGPSAPVSQPEAAEQCNVGLTSLKRAAKVIDKGCDELVRAVDAGVLPVSGAASIADLSHDDQRSIVAKVEGGAKNVARARRQLTTEKIAAVAAPKIASARVLHGDAIELVRAMTERPHVVITDPPYGVDVHCTRTGSKDYADGYDYAPDLLRSVFAALEPKLADDAHVYVFSGYTHIWTFQEILREFFDVQKSPLIWVKENHTVCDYAAWYPNKHEYVIFAKKRGSKRPLAACVPDVLEYARDRNEGHSAQKPVDLLKLFIEQSSVPGELILDPFCGSGSTGVAAVATKRKFIGFELAEQWARMAESRIAGAAA